MSYKKILLSGGTGFIGKKLCEKLIEKNFQVTVLTRNLKNAQKVLPSQISLIDKLPKENNFDIIINLAGETIAQRWTKKAQEKIYQSRINTTKSIVDSVNNSQKQPELFINGSAIGYYFDLKEKELTEDSIVANTQSFSAKLCFDWELEAKKINNHKTRICLLRTGVVLEKDGGTLKKLLPSFKFFVGGKIASGLQYFSWIHLDDLINIIIYLIENKEIEGAINATAPTPITNLEFTKSFGKALNRPTLFTVPAFVLKLIFGKMAEELMIEGQKVLPKKLQKSGYKFIYPNIDLALQKIFKTK